MLLRHGLLLKGPQQWDAWPRNWVSVQSRRLEVSWWAQADVAVLDEIDSGLDIDAMRDVASAVNGLKRPDSATLMVTHYKVRPCAARAAPACLPCTRALLIWVV